VRLADAAHLTLTVVRGGDDHVVIEWEVRAEPPAHARAAPATLRSRPPVALARATRWRTWWPTPSWPP
jgi:hypothetical protein